MDHALEEFSAQGYRGASVNNIFDPKQDISDVMEIILRLLAVVVLAALAGKLASKLKVFLGLIFDGIALATAPAPVPVG